LVTLLLEHGGVPAGGSVGTCDTPLTAAAAAGHLEVLKRLLAAVGGREAVQAESSCDP
jgi:hypothetical protein